MVVLRFGFILKMYDYKEDIQSNQLTEQLILLVLCLNRRQIVTEVWGDYGSRK